MCYAASMTHGAGSVCDTCCTLRAPHTHTCGGSAVPPSPPPPLLTPRPAALAAAIRPAGETSTSTPSCLHNCSTSASLLLSPPANSPLETALPWALASPGDTLGTAAAAAAAVMAFTTRVASSSVASRDPVPRMLLGAVGAVGGTGVKEGGGQRWGGRQAGRQASMWGRGKSDTSRHGLKTTGYWLLAEIWASCS